MVEVRTFEDKDARDFVTAIHHQGQKHPIGNAKIASLGSHRLVFAFSRREKQARGGETQIGERLKPHLGGFEKGPCEGGGIISQEHLAFRKVCFV